MGKVSRYNPKILEIHNKTCIIGMESVIKLSPSVIDDNGRAGATIDARCNDGFVWDIFVDFIPFGAPENSEGDAGRGRKI